MVAICSMIRKPLAFKTWLDYHISLGIEHFFLRIEDTPELSELLDQYPGLITCEYDDEVLRKDWSYNWHKQSYRQEIFVNKTIKSCNKLGFKWIAHIDCDELICANNLNFLDSVPDEYPCAVIENYEAIYPSDDIQDPFLGTDKFLSDGQGRLAYANGKSIGRVSEYLKVRGVHRFTGKVFEIGKEALILHYESPNFDKWYQKYLATKDHKLDSVIDFKFIKQSIEIIKTGDLKKIRDFYNEQKVKPYYDSFSHQIFWTPMSRQKNIFWKKFYGKFHKSLYN